MSVRLRLRAVAAAALAAVVLAVAPGRCQGQDLMPYLNQYNAQVAKGQYPQAEKTARAALKIATDTETEDATGGWLGLLGNVLLQQRKYPEAESVYRRELPILVKLFGADHADVGNNAYNQAIVQRELANYEDAEWLFNKAIEVNTKALGADHKKVGTNYNGLGQLYQLTARFSQAEDAYLKAIGIIEKAVGRDDPEVAYPLANLGTIYDQLGRNTEAESTLKRALSIREKALGPDHPFTGSIHNFLSDLYSGMGRFDLAEPEIKKGMASYVASFGPESSWVASELNRLGRLNSQQGRKAEAEAFYRRALAINEKALGVDSHDTRVMMRDLASVLTDLGRYAEAEPLLRKALAIDEKLDGRDSHPALSTVNNLGELELERGRARDAEPYFRRALATSEKLFGRDHASTLLCRARLARALRAQGKVEEARRQLDGVIAAGERAGIGSGNRHDHLLWRAELAWQGGQRAAALDDLRAALRLAEDQRGHSSGAERERADLFANYTSSYERMIEWQAELGGVAEALAAIERSRARSLLDEMATAGADLQAGRTPEERIRIEREGAAAREPVARLEKQLAVVEAAKDRKAEADRLRAELTEARKKVYDHDRDARTSSPIYRELLNHGAESPGLEEIRRKLCGGDGVLLEYLVGKDGGYVIALGPDFARLVKLEVGAAEAKALGVEPGLLTAARLRAALAGDKGSGVLPRMASPTAVVPVEGLAALWRSIVPEDVRKGLTTGKFKRLVVVPDGPLSLLPFEALVVEAGDAPTYLLDAGPPIVYAPSATVAISLSGHGVAAPRADREPILALGDPAYPGAAVPPGEGTSRSRYGVSGGALPRLPYSGLEADWVAKAFNDAGVKAVKLTGPTATEAGVRYWATGRRVLHLACHGLADETLGNFYGALALTPGPTAGDDQADDGFLTLSEICGLDLKGCELAVLSACRTNFGPQQIGEGTWSLSRGFLVAGTRRVVASNWLVDDEAAASLVSIYSTMLAKAEKEGKAVDYAASLRDAKRWVRTQEKWKPPYYWATLVLVGPP
jgi:CHAT domain-containing protein/tetratricopeptide (TPR) repeat protein